MAQTREQLLERYGDRHKWLVLLTVMIGSMAAIMSSTIVNVAVPDLSRHFVLGQERAQWVATSFMLAMTLSMLMTPWMLLRFGLRRSYTCAIVMLLVGGFAGGFSVNYPMLISMRVLEGLAAGLIQPIPAIVILRSFDEKEQGRAMGIFGFGVVLAPAIGPSVGGILVEHFGWRSIFFVVVPFCLIALALIQRYLPFYKRNPDAARLDWKGLLLAGVATVAILNGMVVLREDLALAVGLLVLGAASAAIFIAYQLRARAPLIDMRLFRYRQFTMGALVAFIYGMALFGSTYLVPVYMQVGLAYSPSYAGLILLPAGIALAITIPLAGKLSENISPNILVSLGLGLLALSFGLMAMGKPGTSYLLLMAWALLGRVGLGLVLPSLSLGTMRGVDFSLIAQGASTTSFLRQLGGAIGVSLVGVMLEWRSATHALRVTGKPGDELADALQKLRAFDETFLMVSALCVIAVLAALYMRPRALPVALDASATPPAATPGEKADGKAVVDMTRAGVPAPAADGQYTPDLSAEIPQPANSTR
jgi:DHA2 family multidrug resistance protein